MLALSALLAAALCAIGPAVPAAMHPAPAAPPASGPARPGADHPASAVPGGRAEPPKGPVVSPDYEFERGKTAFSRGEYERAIAILQPLLYPEVRLETEGSVVQAHRMLGVAHLFENRPDDARREFRKLLELRPDYRFDPLLDPPRVVELFNDVVKEEENEIASVEAKRKKREGERAQRRREEAERVCRAIAPVVRYQKHSFAINFLPLGAGQFQNGQRRKGWLFFGTEAVLGAVSVATFSSNFILFGFTPKRNCLDPPSANPNGRCMNIDHSQEDLSNQLLRVQLVSGALFAAVAFLGVVDAIRNFTDEVQVSPPPASGPAAPAAGPEAAAPAPAAARRKVTSMPAALLPTPFPLVEGTSTGLGFKWRF